MRGTEMGWQVGKQIGLSPSFAFIGVDIKEFLRPFGQRRLPPTVIYTIAIRAKHLQAFVTPIGNVHVTIGIHSHARGPVELAIAIAGLAIAGDEGAIGVEFLNAVIAPIGHVDVALPIDRDTPWHVELAGLTARPAPLSDVLSIGVKFLDPVIMLVCNIDVVIGVNHHPRRPVKFALSAARSAPFLDKFSRRIEDRNLVGVLVGNVKAFLSIQHHGHWQHELAIARAIALAEFTQVVLVPVDDPDSDQVGAHCVAPVEHKNTPVLAHRYVVRIDKPRPSCTVTEPMVLT